MTAKVSEGRAPLTMKGWKAREQAARDKREGGKVDPAIREARAALLERREATMAVEDEAETRKASRPAELFRETLALVPDSLLEELQRTLPSLATRQMSDLVGDVLTGRRRARHAADIAPKPEVAPPAEVTPTAEVAERPTRARRTASATPVAA